MNLNQIILLTVTIFTMIVVYCWAVTFAASFFQTSPEVIVFILVMVIAVWWKFEVQRNENRIRDSLSAHQGGAHGLEQAVWAECLLGWKALVTAQKGRRILALSCACRTATAGVKPRVFKHPVYITFYHNDGLDIDNHAAVGKMVADALKGVLIADDDRKHFAGVRHLFWDGSGIRVEIEEE